MISLIHELPEAIGAKLLEYIKAKGLDQNQLLTELVSDWLDKSA